MDQGRYGEEKDREENSYQGSYGAQAESWVCPACETVNTQDKCVVCGYQNEPKVDKVTSERKKRPYLIWAAAACLVAVVFLALSIMPKRSVTELPQNNEVGPLTETETVTEDIAEKLAKTLMTDNIELENATSAPVFGSIYQRQQIASITFLATTKDATPGNWDVSQNQDGTVLAWVEPNGDLYDLFIGAEGGVRAPENCVNLFFDYINLRQIDFNDAFDTANVSYMGWMFCNCKSLTDLDLSDFDTTNVTNMYAMFRGCSSLTALDVSGFNTFNVTGMFSMFYDCSSLTELDVSGFDTTNVTDMICMFDGCSSLTELDVSGFDTINVTNMESMFNHCSSLTELDVSSFDTANVTSMYAMFDNCSRLTTLDVSGFDTTNVTNMGGMFGNCSSLTELDVSSFDTANVTSMYAMFYNCSSLTALDVADFDTAKVTNMGFMFRGCSNVAELDVSHFDVTKVKWYEEFMDYGRTINGRPWEEFFNKH